MLFTVLYQDGRTYTSILEFRTSMETAAGAVLLLLHSIKTECLYERGVSGKTRANCRTILMDLYGIEWMNRVVGCMNEVDVRDGCRQTQKISCKAILNSIELLELEGGILPIGDCKATIYTFVLFGMSQGCGSPST